MDLNLKNKQFDITAKDVKMYEEEDGTLYISGLASTSDRDRGADVVLASAWEGALENYIKNPIILAYHKHDAPIGSVVDYQVSDRGLFIKAKISDTATEIKTLITEGVLRAFSIGFSISDAEYLQESDTFIIKELELLEISVVAVPMNQNSLFSVAKAVSNINELNELKQQFKPKQEEKKIMTDKTTEAPAFDMEAAFKGLADTITTTMAAKAAEPAPVSAPAVVEDNTEKLLADIEKRFEERMETTSKASEDALEGYRTELKEKADEIAALQKSKMTFQDTTRASISRAEKEAALVTAKILNRDLQDTKVGKELLTKAGSTGNDHIPSTDWENEFQTNAVDDIRKKLVVEPLFRRIMMNTYNLYIPINPDPASSEVTWVQRAAFGSAASTGVAQTQALTDTTLTAYKIATKEYLNDEEEEDAILAVAPIIRDAIVRRMAKGTDKAMLVGLGNGTTDPLTGVATIATTAGGTQVTIQGGTLAATDKVTVADLATVRRGLGEWGLDPSEVVYVVSNEAYYDLLEDPDFRTIDLVGQSNATILSGQIGFANGSPIVVSGEFNAKGANVPYAACINKSNFLVGELRGMKMERDRNIEEQRAVLVATRRIGFLDVISTVGTSVLTYPAT